MHRRRIVLLWAELLRAGLRLGLGQREALEHFFQPHQQALLRGVAQGQLHLTTADGQAHVHRCGRLWQGWGWGFNIT